MENDQRGRSAVALLLRAAAASLGAVMLIKLTAGLLAGSITYSVGEIDAVNVTTNGFWETLLVYLAFSPIMVAMIVAGFAPHAYLKFPSLWKVLLATCVAGYLGSSIFVH